MPAAQGIGRLDADEIRRAITILWVLRQVGWRERPRRRFDCGFCQRGHRGHSTVSYTDKLFHCFRCGAGGDIFTLVQMVRRCSFIEALRHLADRAGIVPVVESREQTRQRHQREDLQREKDERDEQVTDYLERRARQLRFLAREYLWFFEGVQRSASLTLKDEPANEQAWAALIAADKLVRSFDAKYKFLAFGPASLRADYILHPERREAITHELLERGGFRDDATDAAPRGRWWELP